MRISDVGTQCPIWALAKYWGFAHAICSWTRTRLWQVICSYKNLWGHRHTGGGRGYSFVGWSTWHGRHGLSHCTGHGGRIDAPAYDRSREETRGALHQGIQLRTILQIVRRTYKLTEHVAQSHNELQWLQARSMSGCYKAIGEDSDSN